MLLQLRHMLSGPEKSLATCIWGKKCLWASQQEVSGEGNRRARATLGSVAERSAQATASEHVMSQALAVGDEGSEMISEQQLRGWARRQRTQYEYTLPQGDGADYTHALLPESRYEFVGKNGVTQLVLVATILAADSVETAGFDPPTVR